jgi:hypothetical protein
LLTYCPSNGPQRSAVASVTPPALEDARDLIIQELDESSGLLQLASDRGVGTHRINSLTAHYGSSCSQFPTISYY